MRTLGLILFIGLVGHLAAESDPIVETPIGKFRGSVKSSASKRQYFAFRGIRYAKAPVGDLRFKDPEPADPFDQDEYDATSEGPHCIQFDLFFEIIRGSEDCLALNVYTPELAPAGGLLPVMVWIHGGGFMIGSGNGDTDMFGPKFLMNRDIVLVTINYRLGPFGFFTTEDGKAPGNYGLLDQTLALEWVQKNIKYFGGNPESVTIFGESAGGASVHFHVISPRSKGLFHRAIAQSGTSLCPWATPEALEKHSRLVANETGCSQTSSEDLIACLRTKNAKDVIRANTKLFGNDMAFGPRIDTERESPFLPEAPKNLMKTGRFNHVPFITGVTRNEGRLVIGMRLGKNGEGMKEQVQSRPDIMYDLLALKDKPNKDELALQVQKKYLQGDLPFDQQIDELDQMISDSLFFKCADDAIKWNRQFSSEPSYYYLYNHRGQESLTPLIGAPPDFDPGVSHADELFMLFSNFFLPPTTSADDLQVREMMLDLWTSFAIEGVPRSNSLPEWTTTKDDTKYLNIQLEPVMVNEEMPFYERLAFWDGLTESSSQKDEL